jgi:hypothetical protein
MTADFDLSTYLTLSRILKHFVTGILSGWLGAKLLPTLAFHLGWEIYTNSTFGREMNMKIFGRDLADHSWKESAMDNLLFVLGWGAGYLLTQQGVLPANPLASEQ